MQKIRLTDLTIPSLPPGMYWDNLLPGFGVRVGRRSKAFITVRGGQRTTLGRYPDISLKTARSKAAVVLNGSHDATAAKTLEEAVSDYLELYVRPNYRPRSAYNTERLLKGKTAHLEKRYLTTLTAKDFHLIFDTLKPSQANHVFGAYQTFFNWCEKREYCTNPLAKLDKPSKEQGRKRVLTDAELKAIWHACEDDAYGKIVRMLLLTGQRRGEISALESGWLQCQLTASPVDIRQPDINFITFPPNITKNGEEHTIPLSETASAMIAASFRVSQPCADQDDPALPTFRGTNLASPNSNLLFPSSKTGLVIIGFQKMKRELNKRSGVTDWTLHDLRRTFATRLADLGVLPHVIERCLNHTSGTISPLAKRYNRALYLTEMKAAFDVWDAHISRLISATDAT